MIAPEPKETAIQAAILELIRVAYPSVFVAAVTNGGYLLDPRVVSKLKWQGLKPGFPDLTLYWPGGHALVEVKRPSGRLSVPQRDVHEALRALGVTVAIWRSVDDAKMYLDQWLGRKK